MGKKTTTKPEAALKRAATVKATPVIEMPAAIEPPQPTTAPVAATNGSKPKAAVAKARASALPVAPAAPAKAAAAAKSMTKAPAKTAKKKPAYSHDDVALRAYFIAERRQAAGLPGDAHQDWIEAERQLASEAIKLLKPKPKATAKKR